MWTWLKDNGTALIALATILTAVLTSNNAIHHRLNDIRADMNQRFDAQDKRLDGLEADMNQRFDAQDKRIDGLEADMNQRFDAQDKRIDDLKADMNQRFDAQDKYINQRFDAQDKYMSQRFDIQDKRLDGLTDEVSQVHRLSDRITETTCDSTRLNNSFRPQTLPRPELSPSRSQPTFHVKPHPAFRS